MFWTEDRMRVIVSSKNRRFSLGVGCLVTVGWLAVLSACGTPPSSLPPPTASAIVPPVDAPRPVVVADEGPDQTRRRPVAPAGEPDIVERRLPVRIDRGATTSDESAQSSDPWLFMAQAVGAVVRVGHEVAQQSTALGWYENVSVLGAFVRVGQSSSFRLPLRAGEIYAFVGGGDNDATDVDLLVKDSTGQVLARDRLANATPSVVFSPPTSGSYSITVDLYSATTSGSFVALAVLSNGPRRYSVPLDNLVSAFMKGLAQAALLSEAGGIRWYHEGSNQWAMFGQVVEQGDSMRIQQLTMDERLHAVVAAGDDTAQDLDLFLRRQGRMLKSDDDLDATPMLSYYTSAGPGYEIEVKNVRSRGPSLVVATIVER
jgi:hypothetical protein